MHKNLAQLLGKPEAEVAKAVDRLEELAGFPSEDARLLAENNQATRIKIAQLGLDPDDTTGPELFHALSAKFQIDADSLDKAVGFSGNGLAAKLAKASLIVQTETPQPEVWALKTAAAKDLLKSLPPKKSMKLLGYRSVDSMLKRQDPAAIILASAATESAAWQRQLAAAATKLTTASFELRSVKIITLDAPKWAGAASTGQLVVSNNLVGAVAVWPGVLAQKASILACALFLADELQKLQPNHTAPTISAYPSLRFWQGTEHLLAWNGGQPVSLNLKDNCLARLHSASYGQAPTTHAAHGLYKELLAHYQKHVDIPEELDQIGYQVENVLTKFKVPAQQMATEFAIEQEMAV